MSKLDIPFEEVFSEESAKKHGLSSRSYNEFVRFAKNRKCETLGDIAGFSEETLKKSDYISKPALIYIKALLAEHGLTPGMEEARLRLESRLRSTDTKEYISLVKGLIRALLYMHKNGGPQCNPWEALYYCQPELVAERKRDYLRVFMSANKTWVGRLHTAETLDAVAKQDYWTVWEVVNRHFNIQPPLIVPIDLST